MLIIGERINPSGRPSLALALLDGNIKTFQKEALDQERAGVDALDVNVYLPRIDRLPAMQLIVQGIRCVSRLPLVIDDRDPAIIEIGLECARPAVMMNTPLSTHGIPPKVIELLHRFKAKIMFVPLGKNNPPRSRRERLRASRMIVKMLEREGISRKRVLVDAILFPVKRAKEKVIETLSTVKALRGELGVSAVIGLSNVSYGLQNRELVNAAFLRLARSAGLDAVILNPLQKTVMEAALSIKKTPLKRSDISRFFEWVRSVR